LLPLKSYYMDLDNTVVRGLGDPFVWLTTAGAIVSLVVVAARGSRRTVAPLFACIVALVAAATSLASPSGASVSAGAGLAPLALGLLVGMGGVIAASPDELSRPI